MDKWEYSITRDTIGRKENVFECGLNGSCFVHDFIESELLEILNNKGEEGWELIHIGYHYPDVLGVWKRRLE
ncbi:MAG: hypothetical protein SVY15_05080 [Halobacteriota archaeon]|nr:hypothetical protein [Halobacteriota archaeon]